MKELRRSGSDRYLPAVFVVLVLASPAAADVNEYLGRTLLDVRVEIGGVLITDQSLVQLVGTHVGQPLAMEQVRATIDHLVGLGRFEDVRLFAEPAGVAKEAVSLTWVLVPVERLGRIEIPSSAAIDAGVLRAEIAERFGSSPPRSRMPEIVRMLTELYSARGYRRPSIEPRFDAGRRAEVVDATLLINPGPRTTVGEVSIEGDGLPAGSPSLVDIGLDRGRPYDRVAIDAQLEELENTLRDQGYYEATAGISVEFADEERVANVVLNVDRGPLVRVVFAGDPLPENRRDELVPVRQERSVDLDLLEDASRNIENYLRQQGYRAGEATYVREERGGEMVLTFTVRRGLLHRLASLEASGNAAVPRTDLEPLLVLKPEEPLVDSRVATVASGITELYRVRGFARAVVKPELALLPEQVSNGQQYRPVAVRMIVNEGQPTTVGAVMFHGAQQIPETRLRPLLALIGDRPFYRPQLDADRDAIERFYQNEGFRAVRVEAKTDVRNDGREIDIHWLVTEGPQTLVDHILVTGNLRTDEDVILREVTLQLGKPLSDDAMVESQRRLAALGLFRRVRLVELPHTGSSNRDVIVEVEEAPSTTLLYGGGLEAGRRFRPAEEEGGQAEERIDVAPRGFFQVSRRNLWGKNRSVSLLARVSFRPRDPAIDSDDPTAGGYGFNEYRVLGSFREPRLFNRPGDVQFTGFLEQAVRTSFNFSRRGVRAEYARPLRPSLTVGGRWALERTRVFDVKIDPEDQLLIDRLFPQFRLSTLTGSILLDSRNDVVDPERGSVLGFDTTLAARSLGSEVGFVRSFGQAFAYRRLRGTPNLTFVAGLRLGLAVGFERLVQRVDADGAPVLGDDGEPIFDVVADLPASERFFAGGDTTVRGFVLDRLGTEETLNEDGFPTGGNGLIVANLELRTAYWKGLGAVGFFDTGNVFKRAGDIQLDELRPTAGFGLRYRSPLGPLRVDLGFNLDRQTLAGGGRERGMVFHLSLGQAF